MKTKLMTLLVLSGLILAGCGAEQAESTPAETPEVEEEITEDNIEESTETIEDNTVEETVVEDEIEIALSIDPNINSRSDFDEAFEPIDDDIILELVNIIEENTIITNRDASDLITNRGIEVLLQNEFGAIKSVANNLGVNPIEIQPSDSKNYSENIGANETVHLGILTTENFNESSRILDFGADEDGHTFRDMQETGFFTNVVYEDDDVVVLINSSHMYDEDTYAPTPTGQHILDVLKSDEAQAFFADNL